MAKAARDFQVFVKPGGAVCNLECRYCYYLGKERLYPERQSFRMPDGLLEATIVQHIEAAPGPVIRFSWHGGEPTVLGLAYFRKIVALQGKHQPSNRTIANGLQTNGVLLDEDWGRFLAAEGFAVGLSLDGPPDMHDPYRVGKDGKPTHERAMRGYDLLRKHGVPTDILCVVNAHNVRFPTNVYRFFKRIGAPYLSFLPMVKGRAFGSPLARSLYPRARTAEVDPQAKPGAPAAVKPPTDIRPGAGSDSVPAEAWGDFLCAVFDEWVGGDIGRVKVQIFEEAARTAFNQEHSLCIFRPVCGDVPVVEHNGDFYSCDHFVDAEHRRGNILETPLADLLESPAQRAFGQAKLKTLPRTCLNCEVRDMCNGECPKNRFLRTADGEEGMNVLCAGYRRFFNHCRPFVDEVAAAWRAENLERQAPSSRAEAGRNDPCPCGSGKKYKKCCLGK
jgi:uncharacterized protein